MRVRLAAVLGALTVLAATLTPTVAADAAGSDSGSDSGTPAARETLMRGHYQGRDDHGHHVSLVLNHFDHVTHVQVGNLHFPSAPAARGHWHACEHHHCLGGYWLTGTQILGDWSTPHHPHGVGFHVHWVPDERVVARTPSAAPMDGFYEGGDSSGTRRIRLRYTDSDHVVRVHLGHHALPPTTEDDGHWHTCDHSACASGHWFHPGQIRGHWTSSSHPDRIHFVLHWLRGH